MDFLLGVFTGYFLTWPGFVILCILGTLAESNEAHGVATFLGIVTAVTAFFFFHVPPETIALYVAGYFGVGIMWSVWRYKRHAAKVVEEHLEYSEASRKEALRSLHPVRMLNKLTTWVIIWPFSAVENVTGDVIKIVQLAITKFFKGIYMSIYNQAVGQLLPKEEVTE